MSHQLERNGTEVAFVDNRNDAWHQLNNLPAEYQGKKISAEVALEAGHLADWNVRKVPAYALLDGGEYVAMPGQFATVRDNPWTPGQVDLLGSVGSAYVPVQNESNIDVLNAVIDETGATIETAGSLRDGKNVFVTMKLPDTMSVGGVDKVDLYIAGLNSHDGTSAYNILVSPVRVVCANTQSYALRNFEAKHPIRHTSSATKKIELVRQSLGLAFKYAEELQVEADKMIDTAQTEAQFLEIVNQIWTPDDEPSKRAVTVAAERTAKLVDLFSVAPTQANIRGTRWAGLQAVTEYMDHFAPVHSGQRDEATQRAERVLVGSTAASKSTRQKAFDLFSVN
jgi:phage/plasmid-like protein (TIGR03299 family)